MSTLAATTPRPRVAVGLRLSLPTVAIAAVTTLLAWRGWEALGDFGPWRAMRAGQLQFAGPVVIGFVLVVFLIEQVAPAQRRRVLARGQLLDTVYLVAHGLVVVPVIVLIGTGFSSTVARSAPWLVVPRSDLLPRWAYVVLALVAIDAVDWLAHLANHKVRSLWHLHAVHHSQEELSILSTFRTHPLVHLSFVVSAVPVLALSANAATPAVVLTAYACLGALPHANVRWSYGRLGRWFVSPTYHRRHHSPTDRLDVNLGTVLTVWDRLSGRAAYPAPLPGDAPASPTGLAGRPIPIEQATAAGPLRVLAQQWIQPFRRSPVPQPPFRPSTGASA